MTASGTPPHNNDAPCPDFTGIDNIEDMKKWLHDQLTQKCAGEKDPKVFIAALEGDFKIDRDETIKYRSFVYNNQLLGNLIHCIADELSEFKVEPGTCECIYEKGPVAFEPNKSWAWTFENPFGRIPIIDVYEKLTAGKTKKVKPGQQFIFFLKKTQTREMAQLLDVTEEYIDKKARSLEKFHEQVSRKKEDSVVPLDKPLKTYFDEISKTFNIRLTGRLKRQLTTRVKGSELTYHQLINRVYFIEYEVEQDVLWRKISHELDIQVDEDQVKITNPKGRKEGVIKVVMMGQQSITKI